MSDKKRTPQEEQMSKLRKLSRKRWFYPAVYLCAAAVVMIGSLWLQHSMSDNQKQDNKGQVAMNKDGKDALPVTVSKEVFQWPVVHKDAVKIAVPFYDVNADAEEQVAALVNYNNTYTPSKGICIVANDNKSFDVTASMSGKVVKAEKDDLLGYIVEIQHSDGVKTVYESLGKMDVEEGQAVNQGDVIGTAGTAKYMEDLGIHLHFEVRKDGVAVDPVAYFQKGVASLDKVTKENNNQDNQMNRDNNNMDNSNNDSNNNMDRQKGTDDNSSTKENSSSTDESSTSTDSGDSMNDSGSNS